MEENQASRCSSSSATAHAKHTAGERKERKSGRKENEERKEPSVYCESEFIFLPSPSPFSTCLSACRALSTSAPQLNFPLSFGWCISISASASAAITTCFPALCTHKSAPTSSEPFFLRRKDTLPFPPSPRPLSLIGYPIPPVISSELVGESIPSALLYSTETEKSRFPVHVKQC